jgi:putative ABC transport system permease protein
VLGADVARELGYALDSELTIAHGTADVSFAQHDEEPFHVVGILAPTGTPVDRTVHVSLESMEELHSGQNRAPVIVMPGETHEQARERTHPHQPITAFFVGMRDRAALLTMQRALNEYQREPLSAIIPGVALKQLWDLIGIADRALLLIAGFVVFAGLLGMLTAILVSLNERRREMAILRSVGARPRHVFTLLASEAGLLAAGGVLGGVALTYALLALGQGFFTRYGIYVPLSAPTGTDLAMLAGIVAAGLCMGAWPAWRAYRNTLADGLTIRV